MHQSKWKLWNHNVNHTQFLSWMCVWPSQPQIRDHGWTTGPQVERREPTHWTLHMSWVPSAGAVLGSHYMPRSLSLSSLPCSPMSSWSWWKEGKKKQLHNRDRLWDLVVLVKQGLALTTLTWTPWKETAATARLKLASGSCLEMQSQTRMQNWWHHHFVETV